MESVRSHDCRGTAKDMKPDIVDLLKTILTTTVFAHIIMNARRSVKNDWKILKVHYLEHNCIHQLDSIVFEYNVKILFLFFKYKRPSLEKKVFFSASFQ